MKIREYTFDDAEAHAEVHRESVRGLAPEDYSQEEIEAWVKTEPEDSPLDENKVRFVAETGEGEVVGFSDYNKDEGEVTGVYVKPEYSGEGLGQKLLQKNRDTRKKQWNSKINLSIHSYSKGILP